MTIRSATASPILLAVTLAALALAASAPPAAAQQAPDPDRCRNSEEARQLDFWIGTWDVFNPEGEEAGVNVIEPMLNHCALMESWTGARGSSGRSLNFYDPQRKTWRQVWVSDIGMVLDYRQGELRDGAMRFQGLTINPEGDTTLQKLTFEPLAPDSVLQVFEASTDRGASWDTTWVGLYVKREGG